MQLNDKDLIFLIKLIDDSTTHNERVYSETIWELHTIKNSYLIILDLIIEYIFIELKKYQN